MARAALLLVSVFVFLIVGVQALNAGFVTSGEDHFASNESFTPVAGSAVELGNSSISNAIYDKNVTVEDENGTEMEPGTDYDWIRENGTIVALAGGGLDGDASATIDYGWQEVQPEAQRWAGFFADLFASGEALLLALAALVVLVITLRALGGA